ncbi:MAG: phytanoyl-CoA dioxygenase family protein [Nitrospinales bacterium]
MKKTKSYFREYYFCEMKDENLKIKNEIFGNGFAVVNNFMADQDINYFKNIFNGFDLNKPGKRNLFRYIPAIKNLAKSIEVRKLVEPVLGEGAVAVRAIYFDKTPEMNWGVSWHQDLTVATKEKFSIEGFSGWTMKSGIQHALAPRYILEQMLTLRIQLDESSSHSGGLNVCHGSQKLGILDASKVRDMVKNFPVRSLSMRAGDALLMRPLLIHSSNKSMAEHRRVIHIEFAGVSLPNPLEWYEAVA